MHDVNPRRFLYWLVIRIYDCEWDFRSKKTKNSGCASLVQSHVAAEPDSAMKKRSLPTGLLPCQHTGGVQLGALLCQSKSTNLWGDLDTWHLLPFNTVDITTCQQNPASSKSALPTSADLLGQRTQLPTSTTLSILCGSLRRHPAASKRQPSRLEPQPMPHQTWPLATVGIFGELHNLLLPREQKHRARAQYRARTVPALVFPHNLNLNWCRAGHCEPAMSPIASSRLAKAVRAMPSPSKTTSAAFTLAPGWTPGLWASSLLSMPLRLEDVDQQSTPRTTNVARKPWSTHVCCSHFKVQAQQNHVCCFHFTLGPLHSEASCAKLCWPISTLPHSNWQKMALRSMCISMCICNCLYVRMYFCT